VFFLHLVFARVSPQLLGSVVATWVRETKLIPDVKWAESWHFFRTSAQGIEMPSWLTKTKVTRNLCQD